MKIHVMSFFTIVLGLIFSCSAGQKIEPPPYPPSPIIKGIQWEFNNQIRLAPGSDLWPVTWADDDNLYTSWGDGGGFGGTNSDGRVSLGFGRIEGYPPNIKGTNIWGGKNALNRAKFKGKCPAIISIEGTLYAFINLQNSIPPDMQLVWSEDHGATWQKTNWTFSGDGPFFPRSFLEFGRDYLCTRDKFVYIYGSDRSNFKSVYLARVSKDRITRRESYEFFHGLNSNGKSSWTFNIKSRKPVGDRFKGGGSLTVVYNAPVNRYILIIHHGYFVGKFGVFDAPEPWGPWTTVAYYDDWGGLGGVTISMPHTFPSKWISHNGKTLWMVFSGTEIYDSFNLIKANLILK